VAFAHLLLGLRRQRPVDDVQELVVLPQAQTKGQAKGDTAHDQARAQLFEMVNEAESILVSDWADRGGHVKRLEPARHTLRGRMIAS
jgi:hypothetical protein